jgi:cell division protein FtsW
MQPDIGQSLLLTIVFIALLFLSGEPLRRILLITMAGAVALVLAYAALPHVKSRIDRFLDPEAGDTYQMDRARDSFIGGGLLGRGPGEGTIKSVLPDAHTDYILAVVAEEYGVLTCLVLLGLYGFVALRALLHLLEEPDRFVRMAVAGLVMLFALQVLINMGVNVGLLPAKGLTLPFISYGGSSMLGMSIAMGMLVALTRRRPGQSGLKSSQFLRSETPIAAGRGSMNP